MNDLHCVSLELAKELAKNGWSKKTEFWWTQHKEQQDNPAYKDCAMICDKETLEMYPIEFWNVFPAPIATEILEELPEDLTKNGSFLASVKCNNGFSVSYTDDDPEYFDESLPNALAKMWLYLNSQKEGGR